MVKTVLIPTDGSPYSRTALDYGIYFAKKLGAALTGLSVIDIKIIQGPLFNDISGFVDLTPYQEFTPMIETGLQERAQLILESFRLRCESEGIHPEVKNVTGLIDETIIEEGQKVDWIILAQRGEHYPLTGVGLLGSTSEAVVRKSGKPVLITPLHYKEITKVGCAYDGSKSSGCALHLAAELSFQTQWPLVILHITDNDARAASIKGKAELLLESYDIERSFVFRRGKEEEEILRFTREDSIDLLVMGAYGHSRLRELILGSTTSFVLRRSTVPVLLTR